MSSRMGRAASGHLNTSCSSAALSGLLQHAWQPTGLCVHASTLQPCSGLCLCVLPGAAAALAPCSHAAIVSHLWTGHAVVQSWRHCSEEQLTAMSCGPFPSPPGSCCSPGSVSCNQQTLPPRCHACTRWREPSRAPVSHICRAVTHFPSPACQHEDLSRLPLAHIQSCHLLASLRPPAFRAATHLHDPAATSLATFACSDPPPDAHLACPYPLPPAGAEAKYPTG